MVLAKSDKRLKQPVDSALIAEVVRGCRRPFASHSNRKVPCLRKIENVLIGIVIPHINSRITSELLNKFSGRDTHVVQRLSSVEDRSTRRLPLAGAPIVDSDRESLLQSQSPASMTVAA